MEKKDMQPIALMIALAFLAVMLIFAIGFFSIGKLNQPGFLIMLGIAALISAGIARGVKKIWFNPATGEMGMVTEAKNEIEQFAKNKLDEIEKDVSLHKESITVLLQKGNDTSKTLSEQKQCINELITKADDSERKLRNMIPKLRLIEPVKFNKTNSGIEATLSFVPSNNFPLGQILFSAEPIGPTTSKIINFDHAGPGMKIGGKPIRVDKSVRIEFSTVYFVKINLLLVVSEPCKVIISGNYLPEPIEIDINQQGS